MARATCRAVCCGSQFRKERDTLALPKIWEETKMLKHGDTVMRLLQRTKTYSGLTDTQFASAEGRLV